MGLHDFDAARRERQRELEPLEFKLGGEVFILPATKPAGAILDLVDAEVAASVLFEIGTPDAVRQAVAQQRVALSRFVTAILPDEDVPRFDALLRRKTDPVELEDLDQIANWLAEQYAGRPTERSSESSDGPPTNGQTSNRTSSEVEAGDSSTSP